MEKILAVIIAVAIVIFGAVLIFLSRQRKRRMARIQEVKDMFAKRVSIPSEYMEAFGKAKSEREVIDVAASIAQSCGMFSVSAHCAAYGDGGMSFSQVMRSLATGCNNAGKNSAPSNKAMEADFSTPIRHESPRVRPWYERYTDGTSNVSRSFGTGTSGSNERYNSRRHDDGDDYVLQAVAMSAVSTTASSACHHSAAYERNDGCTRHDSGTYGGGGESSGGGNSCSGGGDGGD